MKEKINFFNLTYLKKVFSEWELIYKPVTGSTNNDLFARLKMNASKSYLVLTEYQTAGRGTRGRTWFSAPIGDGLYFSFNYRNFKVAKIVSLRVALGIIDYLQTLGVKDLRIKWPNDIMWQGKKLAGILTETASFLKNQLVIGIGMNLRMPSKWGDRLGQPYSDLEHALGNKNWDRNQLIVGLIEACWSRLKQQALIKDFRRYDFWLDQKVILTYQGETCEGIGAGIDNEGLFLLKTAKKIIRCEPLMVNFLN